MPTLKQEIDFLEKLSIKAAGGSKSNPLLSCPHSEEMVRLSIEKEHLFFKKDLMDKQKDQLMQEIDTCMLKIKCDCKWSDQ